MAPAVSKMAVHVDAIRPVIERLRNLREASQHLLTPQQRRTALYALTGLTTVLALYKTYSSYKTKQRESQETAKLQLLPPPNVAQQAALAKRKKVAVDRVFLKRIRAIVRIIIPTWRSKEFFHLVVLTLLLWVRTMLSINVSEMLGINAQSLVSRNWSMVKWGVFKVFVLAIPASAVNSGLRYEVDQLALRFRKRLTLHVHELYLRGVNYYKASHLGGANKIDNADQRVTDEIEKFSSSLSSLYSNIFKPVLDVVLFTRKLTLIVGFKGPLAMYAYYFISSLFLRTIMPPFPKLVARESELEGNYRMAHQRLITNAEEIAFYDGSLREKNIINQAFIAVYCHTSYVNYLKLLMGCFDGFLVKYGASIVGFFVMCIPVFLDKNLALSKDPASLTKDYVLNTQLLINLARAIGSLVLIYKRLTALAGYTSRVSELIEMVRQLEKTGNEPFIIREEDSMSVTSAEGTTVSTVSVSTLQPTLDSEAAALQHERLLAWLNEWKKRGDAFRASLLDKKRANDQSAVVVVVPGERVLISRNSNGASLYESDFIRFEAVSLVSPEGKLLVHDLSFEVRQNQNVMITGPNGSGKSSLFRILGELWPLHCGSVTKPPKKDIFYVPQKPYLVLGSLRDQIIYPHSVEEMKARGITDEDLEHLMDIVDPTKTILKTWRWEEVKDWLNTFSGGQKQRVAMARLFYHRPKFAILDECTSAVSHEVEGKIYETCAQIGITLFTVSHRAQLRKYHNHQLRFDGEGNWEWTAISE